MRTILRNAAIFDGETLGTSRSTVIVEGDLILDVVPGTGPAAQPGDAEFNLAGMTLIPGMTIGHWHGEYHDVKLSELNSVYLGMEKPPSYLAAVAVRQLKNALMSGFTTVVGAGCSADIDVSMKQAIAEGVIEGPEIVPSGRHINPTGGDNDRAKWWYGLRPPYQDGVSRIGADIFADGPDAMRRAVRDEINRGVEVIKIFPTGGHGIEVVSNRRELTREELKTIIETAHDRGARVRGHVAGADAILECVAAGMDIVDHGDGIDERCIEAMEKSGTFLVPSMLFLRSLLDFPAGIPEALLRPVRNDFDHMAKMMKLVNDAGIAIVPGDDYGLEIMPHAPGIYARDLAIHVDHCGIAAQDVMRWVTVNGAALARRDDALGRIRKGYKGTLSVWRGNPSSDLKVLTDPEANLRMLMKDGSIIADRIGMGAPDVRAKAA